MYYLSPAVLAIRGQVLLYHIILVDTTHGFCCEIFLEMRWTPQLQMYDTKILSMVLDTLHFVESIDFVSMSLKSMPKS